MLGAGGGKELGVRVCRAVCGNKGKRVIRGGSEFVTRICPIASRRRTVRVLRRAEGRC